MASTASLLRRLDKAQQHRAEGRRQLSWLSRRVEITPGMGGWRAVALFRDGTLLRHAILPPDAAIPDWAE